MPYSIDTVIYSDTLMDMNTIINNDDLSSWNLLKSLLFCLYLDKHSSESDNPNIGQTMFTCECYEDVMIDLDRMYHSDLKLANREIVQIRYKVIDDHPVNWRHHRSTVLEQCVEERCQFVFHTPNSKRVYLYFPLSLKPKVSSVLSPLTLNWFRWIFRSYHASHFGANRATFQYNDMS